MTDDPFVAHRSLLFTVAYEMLGSRADAEDVLQETWLRWADVDHSQVDDPRAYLIRVVTRQALNQMRRLSRRREEYVGEWLPEPLLTSPDIADDVELAESVSIAMLTLLETLGPTERAVFVLHEVFEMPYGEIGEAIGKSTVAARQIARRAREHVAARRPRMRVSRSEQQAVVDRFLHALQTGQLCQTGRGHARGEDCVAQRRTRGSDRDRRRTGCGEPPGRGGSGDPDLRHGQPAQADAAGRAGRARALTRRWVGSVPEPHFVARLQRSGFESRVELFQRADVDAGARGDRAERLAGFDDPEDGPWRLGVALFGLGRVRPEVQALPRRERELIGIRVVRL
jgi:RNA polymerase sigma factor (sigma-70 family)